METSTLGWTGLFFILFVSSFGIYLFFTVLLAIFTFLIGFLSLLYLKLGDVEKFAKELGGNPLSSKDFVEGGLPEIVENITTPNKVQKSDNRVTGSDVIDSSLQEILGYVIRDYISPWYGLISANTDFTEISVRKSAQCFAINISNRVKEIDWIPYLTRRLVDESASHLRLFKQAKARMKLDQKPKSPKGSPMKESKLSPKKSMHRRNKSETDINWYHSKSGDIKKDLDRAGKSATEKKIGTMEDYFFDLECQMEGNLVCHDGVCENSDNEKEFVCELTELLLYLLLPEDDFKCQPLRIVLRELFTNVVILPIFTLLSDPDYINQIIIWLCLREVSLPSDIFLTTLRLTDNCDELKSTKESISKEIQHLRSRDSGGDSDLQIKQQLSSLFYVLKLIDTHLLKLESLEPKDSLDYVQLDSIKKIDLSLDQILKNNVALSYFMDYVSSQGKQQDLFFYLNVEGWKVSVEQQLSDLHLNKVRASAENVASVYDTIRSTALGIFEQYLGDKSEQKMDVKPALVQTLYFKIRNLNETPTEQWFDPVQKFIYNKMECHADYLDGFKKSKVYIKLLQELDLLQQSVADEDCISLNSDDNIEIRTEGVTHLNVPNNSFLAVDHLQKNTKHMRSFSDGTMFNEDTLSATLLHSNGKDLLGGNVEIEEVKIEAKNMKTGDFSLSVNIIETGIVCEKGKTFGIYAIRVGRQFESGFLEEWHIYRRYSDFHDLYTKIKERYPDLGKLPFPGKKTFHNMDRTVLERRMKLLGKYMQELCMPSVIASHPNLKDLLMTFLEQGEYDRATGGPILSTFNTLVNPIKVGMKSIKNMPEQIIHTVDEVMGEITKVFQTKSGRLPEASKVGASIEETDDNIPLRIMLLLMDEVFDLKSRNQWLRRRIVTLLRQIIRTMFGDIVNRKILDYVSVITSPKNVAHYLYVFKQSFWPNGNRYEKKPNRDDGTKNRTRVAAKVALLSCLSDELKHIIGSETTRRGLLTVFELFQRPILNKRLLYVLLEGILCTLFPEKDMLKIIHKLHSKSGRLKNIQKSR